MGRRWREEGKMRQRKRRGEGGGDEGGTKQCSMQSICMWLKCNCISWVWNSPCYLMRTYFRVWSHILTVQSAPHDANTF